MLLYPKLKCTGLENGKGDRPSRTHAWLIRFIWTVIFI
jgi:hypothetical protein